MNKRILFAAWLIAVLPCSVSALSVTLVTRAGAQTDVEKNPFMQESLIDSPIPITSHTNNTAGNPPIFNAIGVP